MFAASRYNPRQPLGNELGKLVGKGVGKLNRLSARGVATLSKPGRHADGGNLYLNVTVTGARSWVFMYKFAGRQREMGLGSAEDVPLAKARVLAMDARRAGIVGGYQRHDFALEKRAALQAWGEHVIAIVEGRAVANSVVALLQRA